MEGIRNIPQNFKESIENLKSSFTESINNLNNVISQGLEDLKESIKDTLTELFVPDEDYLTEKLNHIREKFGFADSVMAMGEVFKEMFSVNPTEPPKIVINLGNAESKYNYGGSTLALDMSWYARYKPSVDAILSSIMWVVFGWRLFVGLPNIISGVGSTYEMSQDLRTGTTFTGYDDNGKKRFSKLRGSRKR